MKSSYFYGRGFYWKYLHTRSWIDAFDQMSERIKQDLHLRYAEEFICDDEKIYIYWFWCEISLFSFCCSGILLKSSIFSLDTKFTSEKLYQSVRVKPDNIKIVDDLLQKLYQPESTQRNSQAVGQSVTGKNQQDISGSELDICTCVYMHMHWAHAQLLIQLSLNAVIWFMFAGIDVWMLVFDVWVQVFDVWAQALMSECRYFYLDTSIDVLAPVFYFWSQVLMHGRGYLMFRWPTTQSFGVFHFAVQLFLWPCRDFLGVSVCKYIKKK